LGARWKGPPDSPRWGTGSVDLFSLDMAFTAVHETARGHHFHLPAAPPANSLSPLLGEPKLGARLAVLPRGGARLCLFFHLFRYPAASGVHIAPARLTGSVIPDSVRNAAMSLTSFSRLKAVQIHCHSVLTFSSPRNRN